MGATAPPAPDPTTDRDQRVEQLEEEIVAVAGQLFAGECRFLELVAEFDALDGWACGDTRSCAHWLNHRLGIALPAARERVRVARRLGELPLVRDAFAEGRISYSKVRAITRVATTETEEYLVMLARHGTASQLETICRTWRRVDRAQDADDAAEVHSRREVTWRHDDDGTFVMTVKVPSDQGQILAQAVVKAMELLYQRNREQEAAPATGNVSAETPPADGAPGAPSTTTSYGARQADALIAIAEAFLDGDPVNSSGADRWQLIVHTPAEALADVTADTTPADGTHTPVADDVQPPRREAAHLHDGPVIPDVILRRIACDASLVAMTHDPDGTPIGVGRKTRLIPRRLRRMLARRDVGCQFPGCERTRWLDGHHIWHWADGGPTELENLILLCRACHTTVHDQELTITMDLDRHWVFTRPDGSRVGHVDPLPRATPVHVPDIDTRAALSDWDGSRLDLAAAVDGFGRQRPTPQEQAERAGDVSAETSDDVRRAA